MDASLPAVNTDSPPPIPGARAESTGRTRRPLLIWVRTGTAHVRIDDAEPIHLTAGAGVWIPADGWNHRAVVTEPGTVAFPLLPNAGAGALTEPTRFEVPDSWQDWLIQLFNLQVTPLGGRGHSQATITDLLRRSSSRPSAAARSEGTDFSALLELPEMPRARGAKLVAEELVRDPAIDLAVQQWATRVLSSPRTLRREFLADTGLTFEQWRSRCRLSAAIEFLASGYDLDQVGARVGFASRNGFTRAFKQQFGLTPHELSRKLSADSVLVDPAQRAAMAHQTDCLMQLVSGNSTAAPDLLTGASTPEHANDVHVLSWMYRGSGYLDIGDHRYERERGVATWIPAGSQHITGLRENSVSLPLGNAGTGDLQLTEPLQVRFSPAWDDYLMFCAVSARSILRPDDYDPGHILGLFTEQVTAQRASSVPMPTHPRAHTVAMDYLRRISASSQAAAFDLPADLHRAFLDETGMTFSRWRYAARMCVARDLLDGGAKPSAVAPRVGYAHLPTFSAAFTRFFGVSPRGHQNRGGTS